MKQSTGHVCHTWYKYFGLTTKTLYALEIICHWYIYDALQEMHSLRTERSSYDRCVLEGQWPAEFSSDLPQHTCL